MIKRFLSSIIGFILLILITSLSSFILIRQILFTKQIEELTNDLLTQNNISLKDNVFKEQFISYGIPEEVTNYIDEKETNEYVTEIFELYIKSYLGQGKMPTMNNDKLKKIIDTAVIEYETENNTKVDTTQFYQAIDSYDKTLQEQKQTLNIDERVTIAFKLIYDKNTIIYIIIGIFVCITLLFLINKNIISVLKHISSSLLVNGVGLVAISYIVGSISFEGKKELESLIKYVTNNLNRVAYGSIIIALVIIIGIYLYKKKHKDTSCNEV